MVAPLAEALAVGELTCRWDRALPPSGTPPYEGCPSVIVAAATTVATAAVAAALAVAVAVVAAAAAVVVVAAL